MNRHKQILRLQTEEFDICIIGAGASGAGCALDAVTRGYRTALVEKVDFAAATSSKSTKLIHGGVRYLEQAFAKLDFGQLRQVIHGLEERRIVLNNAPHLARPLALITPVFSWFEGLYFTIGLTLYDWIAGRKDTLPASRWLSKSETLKRLPTLTRRLHSAVLYYDGQLDDARYCLAIAQTAAEAGAALANYTQAVGFEYDETGKLTAARVKDVLSGQSWSIRARVFINCTGPYTDYLRQQANPSLPPRIRPSKGVHLTLPRQYLPSDDALLVPRTPDGRVVFAIPFWDQLLLGTTDNDYLEEDREPVLEANEVAYLLETLAPYLEQPIPREAVQAGFGGLRPLIAAAKSPSGNLQRDPNTSRKSEIGSRKPRVFRLPTSYFRLLESIIGSFRIDAKSATKKLVRDHEVEHDPATGLVSLLGGKWTTYRLMAKDTIDYVSRELFGEERPCRTQDQLLVGAEDYRVDDWQALVTKYDLQEPTARHLHQQYGSRAGRVAALAREQPAWSQPLVDGSPFIAAEVVYAARAEMARTVRDVLARRLRIEIIDWALAQRLAPRVAALLGEELGWPAEVIARAAEEYRQLIEGFKLRAVEDRNPVKDLRGF